MSLERKNYPMKEFRAIFPISSILVIRSGYAKKDHLSSISCISKYMDLHKFGLQIWIQNVKITLWKNFGQFFRFHQFWSSVIKSAYAKKGQFSILAVIQNIWDLHRVADLNSQRKNYPIFGQFFFFHQFCIMRKKVISQYKLFRTQKLLYERISGNFFLFHRFLVIRSGYAKKRFSQY